VNSIEPVTVDLGRYRRLGPFWRAVFLLFSTTGIALSINQVFNLRLLVGVTLLENSFLYAMVGLFLPLVFLMFPAGAKSSRDRVPWYDVAAFLVALICSGYFAMNGLRIVEEAWEFMAPPVAVAFAFVLWVLVLEGVRRAGGLTIFIIITLLSLYPLFANLLPSPLTGLNQDLVATARYHMMSTESMLGIPMQVFGELIIGFIIFGVALQSTGGGRFFIDLAFGMLGGVRGGPAKVAIVASGLFGSLSGSVVTNVLTTGAMTIPAMKRTGYPPEYAGGIEACASTGGVLMPPVMGATAFVMASFLSIPYVDVAIAAIIPSFLYFFGLFVQIDCYAARNHIHGLPKEELPSVMKTLKEGWFYVLAFGLLVFWLVHLRREAFAPFYATVVLLALSQIRRETRFNWARVLAFIQSTGQLLGELIAILAAVGLIIGSLVVTGMAGTFSSDLMRLAGGNVSLLLVMGAITSFIMGMGMTVTAAYIFLAIVLAPALVSMGMDPLAVHLFIMYWGMLSFITPPVALGAFAGASLAGANAMRTGFEAMRLGSIIYFLPFFFVFNPALIMHGTWQDIVVELATATMGVVFLASAMQGHLVGVGSLRGGWLAWGIRGLLLTGGLLLAIPEMITNGAGLLVAMLAVASAKLLHRQLMLAPESSS
jgi:TRAP transporter 4TM/12TM fusion protein